MKKILLSLVSVLLLAAMCLTFGACGNDQGTTPETTTAAAGGPVAETETGEVTTADVFADVKFPGEKFTYLTWKQSIAEYFGDEASGDMVESALFKRNAKVQDMLGIELNFIELAGNSSTFTTFCQTASANVKTATHEYDAIACYTRSASLMMVDGILTDLLNTEYLDFTQTWWPSNLTQLNTIGGKMYFASGDIATSLLYQMMFMAINNDLAKDVGVSGIQELALDGKWTLDKMFEIIKGMYAGTDANGSRLYSDRYGMMCISHTMLDVFYLGSGLSYVEFDVDGEPMISEKFNSDASMDVISRLQNAFWVDGDAYFSNTNADLAAYTDGTSLLYVLNGERMKNYLNQASYDYSILCAPKYNEEQENYYTAVGFPHSMYAIPIDARNPEMSGAVLELTARESYNEVTPVVFDTCFKYRYANGAGDATMFDIIRSGVAFDFGRTLFDQLGGDSSSPIRIWRNEVYNNTKALSSQIKAFSKNWDKALESTIEGIKAN